MDEQTRMSDAALDAIRQRVEAATPEQSWDVADAANLLAEVDALRADNAILERKVELLQQQVDNGASAHEDLYLDQRETMVGHRAKLQAVIDGLRGNDTSAAFTVQKASRVDPARTGSYSGPTCEDALMEPGRVFVTRAEAQAAADALSFYNGVGFVVVDVEKDE
jgi:hypothetical protein